MLARAVDHLGNRHVALQAGHGWLRHPHDHALDDMARGLGLLVILEEVPFEPSGGGETLQLLMAIITAHGHDGHDHDH